MGQELFYRTPSQSSFYFPSSSPYSFPYSSSFSTQSKYSQSSQSNFQSIPKSSHSQYPSQSSSLSFAPPTPPSLSFFDKYQRIGSIHSFLDSLVTSYPELVTSIKIGKSSEGRDLKLIKIGSKKPSFPSNSQSNSQSSQLNSQSSLSFPPSSQSDSVSFPSSSQSSQETSSGKKPGIYIDAGLHAREWISVTTALYVAHALTHDYDVDPDVRKLVDSYDWYIHPVANPDGYEWTHMRVRFFSRLLSSCLNYSLYLSIFH